LNSFNLNIATQLQLICGKIRELPVKMIFKNSLLADLGRALQYSTQDNTLAVLTSVSVVRDKLCTQQSHRCCSRFNSVFIAIDRLQQTLLQSPIVSGQPGPPGPPGPPGKIEFITAVATDTVCLPSPPSGDSPLGTQNLQRNTLYIADGILIFWLCDIVFIAEPVPIPVNFWRIFGAPPEIIDGAGIAQQIPSLGGGSQSAVIDLIGQSTNVSQLIVASSEVGGSITKVRFIFPSVTLIPQSYIGFNPEQTTYYTSDGLRKVNTGWTLDQVLIH
jgi:hypothetical protein